MTTDASLTGWSGKAECGSWVFPWTTEHISLLELRAINLSLRHLSPLLQVKHVLVRTDLLYQPSTRRHQVIALPSGNQETSFSGLPKTHLSRGSRSLFLHLIWARFGSVHTNLFASAETTPCKMWFSLNCQGGPLRLDALSHVWPRGLLYTFPPLPLIPHAIKWLDLGHCRILILCFLQSLLDKSTQ